MKSMTLVKTERSTDIRHVITQYILCKTHDTYLIILHYNDKINKRLWWELFNSGIKL